MGIEIEYKDHFLDRMRERKLAPIDSDYVLKHGTRLVQADGTVLRVLKYTDIPARERRSHARLVGWHAVLSADERVAVTTYPCEGRCSGASPWCPCWGAFRRRRLQLLMQAPDPVR